MVRNEKHAWFQIVSSLTSRADAKAELEQKKRDLKNVEEQLATLIRLQAMLKAQEADINDICARLDSFAKVWSIVSNPLSPALHVLCG